MEEDHLVLPAIYNFTPLRALRVASRRKLSGFLDLEGVLVVVNNDGLECDVVNDYSGLAELAGFNYQDIMNMKRQRSPTTELLDLWTGQNGNVGKLWMYLYMMERYDVLTDCRRPIVLDCCKYEEQQQLKADAERYNIEQDPTVTTSEMKVDETKFATKQDVQSGKRTFYDAFICYTAEDENDRQFLYKMIEELEVKRGLKLFVPGRDDLPGSAEYTITAYLIEKRCTRVVILMSRKFLQSAACDFQVKFAHALAPGARSKKLIPVIREKNTQLPRILRFLAVCDFTKSDMVEWVWDRLFTAIIAPVGPTTYFEEEDPSNPFDMSDESLKDIKFPAHRRLDEHEDSSNHTHVQSRPGSRPIAVSTVSQPREPMECDVSSMSWGQSTSNMQSQSPSSVKSSSLPPETKGKSSQKGATGSVKQSKPVPAKKPDKLKNKKQVSSQRQQPSTDSKTISSSVSTEHFV
ncbi:myeloid differentiation primary response protein MyD88-like [Mercenaria mercenaria]|uniref:myeloid differentiation primary response protein MyD88-like n=1 Tax=Mercenaria mercenaria TaxID=6596 RepID=UPI00234EDF6A|nr:myeloid differentiation primary response protein MyD88-like [Mercenaria mercenaria]